MADKDWYKSLPKKRMGVGVIFLNEDNEILIVKPVYKDHWTLVGGVVDENESLFSAAQREVREEIGLNIDGFVLACVDYISKEGEKDDNLQFIFYGDKLSQKHINEIVLPSDELAEYKFCKLEEALKLVSDKLKRRLPPTLTAINNKSAIYLENGVEK
ncbi:MAG: NUDIX hydrolase [bacterium]|nr:NUDIX hydrolase [bacterium]